jgi:hypothetical protein
MTIGAERVENRVSQRADRIAAWRVRSESVALAAQIPTPGVLSRSLAMQAKTSPRRAMNLLITGDV